MKAVGEPGANNTWIALLVFLGGGLGAVARWSVGQWLSTYTIFNGFPWPTLFINMIGSFVLGLLGGLCQTRPLALAFLGVGVCGGFTTFSTFSVETVKLMEEGRVLAAGGYVTSSVAAAVVGAWIGRAISSLIHH